MAKAVVKSRRAEIKESRQARREEISTRWTRRENARVLVERAAEMPDIELFFRWFFSAREYVEAEALSLVRLAMIDASRFSAEVIAERLARIVDLKEMPYDDFLQTSEWKDRAEQAKTTYGGRCALSDSHPAEHAHHRTYERRGRELPSDIVPLCADCHRKFHNR